jgi:hypothetical protein
MADPTMQAVIARLETQDFRVALLEKKLARYERRQRPYRRIIPVVAFTLLLALAPMTTLADFAFLDLNSGSPHNDNITAIASAGITKGCNPPAFDQYCPNANVTREEMASFLARTAGLGSNPPVANALTAKTATNANQLGGLSADKYVQKAHFTQDGFEVTGDQKFPRESGPQALPSPYYDVFVSGSAFRGSSGGPLSILVELVPTDLSGATYSFTLRGYTNEAQSHKALVPLLLGAIPTPGTQYFIRITPDPLTLLDGNDHVQVLLISFPLIGFP